ncbi:MAG: site-2 protease family protein [Agriterribacter sp.]
MMDADNTKIDLATNKKPVDEEVPESKAVWLKALLSLALYIGIYYFFFHSNIKWVLLLVVVMIVHEAGHFIAMKSFNYRDVQLFFVPFLGAFVSGRPDKISQRQRVITLLAGPLPGIIIGLFFFFLYLHNSEIFYYQLSLMFVLLNIFNLLPVSPLDGGQLLENLFSGANKVIQPVFLALSAIALFYFAVISHNYFVLLIVWLIVTRLRKAVVLYNVYKELDSTGINYHKAYDALTDKDYMDIRSALIKQVPSLKNYDVDEIAEDEEPVLRYVHKLLEGSVKTDMTLQYKIAVIIIWVTFAVLPVIMYVEYAPAFRIF